MADAPDDEPPPERNPYRLDEAQRRRLRTQKAYWDAKRDTPAPTHPGPPGYTVH